MNYYRARELKNPEGNPSGLWHFTQMNDGRIWAVGYCRELNCKHATAVEASNCYRKYIIERCNGLLPGGFKMGEYDENEEMIMNSSY
jgi:hypothetical protein